MSRHRYASNTTVSVDRSQAELTALLRKHGVARVAVLHETSTAAVGFEINGTRVRLEMNIPSPMDFLPERPTEEPRGWRGWDGKKRTDWCEAQAEQVAKQRWRALVLVTKAKLELVAEGMSTVEREFMADVVLPNGQRVEQWLVPQLTKALAGKMPPLLKP